MSQLCQCTGHPDQCCRSLLAQTRLDGPYCLVLQSSQEGSIVPMALQANKSYKTETELVNVVQPQKMVN